VGSADYACAVAVLGSEESWKDRRMPDIVSVDGVVMALKCGGPSTAGISAEAPNRSEAYGPPGGYVRPTAPFSTIGTAAAMVKTYDLWLPGPALERTPRKTT
jgi:hypothetical protein